MFQGRIEVMCGIFLDKNGGRTDWKRLEKIVVEMTFDADIIEIPKVQ